MSDNSFSDLGSLDSLVARAFSALKRSDFAAALRDGVEVLKLDPKNLKAFKISANAAICLRDWREAAKICELWRASFPDDPNAIYVLSNAYSEIGDAKKSRDTYKLLVEADPDSTERLSDYARLCLDALDYDGAAAALEKAQSLGPLSAEHLHAFARLKHLLGELDEARTLSAKVIEANAEFAQAYPHYVTLRGGDVSAEIRVKIEQLAEDTTQLPRHRVLLYFALGDIDHFHGEYSKAMQAFDAGNKITNAILRSEGLAYKAEFFEHYRQQELNVVRALPKKQDFPIGAAVPIFVVGMPRSGTTLIESILASHPDVFGAGELVTLQHIQTDVLKWAASAGGLTLAHASFVQLQAWRDLYFAGYPDIKGARFVVDKQPMNFRWAGLIKSLFPESVIIHIRRNPVDTGFSIYRNDFGKVWPNAASLANIAHFYGEYARITAHWKEALQADFPLVVYEDLVGDFEQEARRLVDLCGLEWRDECLNFHETKRPIATFSAIQVRQPIRKTVASAHEKYGTLLAPLIDGLHRAGVDIETGALKG